MRGLVWLADTKENLSAMAGHIKHEFGYRLRQVQAGKTPHDMKPLFQFGRGVYELRENYDTNAYRLIYVVHLEKAVYVLDVFMKKSKSGIGLPKPDVERIQARLKQAILRDKEE